MSKRLVVQLSLLVMTFAGLVYSYDDVVASYRLMAARSLLRERDWSGAIALLERSSGGCAERHYLLACAYRRSGSLQHARRELIEADRLGWNRADLERQHLLINTQAGGVKELESQLIELIQSSDGDGVAEEVYEAMARGYMTSFHVGDAKQCLQYWLQWQPHNPLPHLWLADLHKRTENLEGAVQVYREVLQRHPRHQEAREKLALALLEQLKVEEAAQLFEICLQSAPSAESYIGIAECERRKGRTAAAEALFHEALVYDLTSQQASRTLTALGQMALEEQKHSRAIYLLETSVKLQPLEPAGHTALAAVLTSVGETSRAAEHRRVARELVDQHNRVVSLTREVLDDPENADLRFKIGSILLAQGMGSAGADWLETAVQVDPAHQSAHLALAEYYEQVGNTGQARKHLATAKDLSASAVAGSEGEGSARED
jgi:Tfp pilus assembly protein PilF